MLITNEVMVDGVVDDRPKAIEFDQEKEISNILEYIEDMHGLARIRDWYADPDKLPDDATAQIAVAEMGLAFINRWATQPAGFYVYGSVPEPLALGDYDYLYRYNGSVSPDSALSFEQGVGDGVTLALDGNTLVLGSPDDPEESLSVDLTSMLIAWREAAAQESHRPLEETTLEAENAGYGLVMYLESLNAGGRGDSVNVTQFTATFLVRIE
jgi:hypothetical protein